MVVRNRGPARSPGHSALGRPRAPGGTDMDVLTCGTIEERLYDYLDRELSLQEETAVRRHLASCEPCQGNVAFEEQFLAAVREKCRATRAPAGLLERIQQSIECL